MIILSLDPGSFASGWAVFDSDTYTLTRFGKTPNDQFLALELGIYGPEPEYALLVCEDIVNQGVNGRSIIQTVRWTGRFEQEAKHKGINTEYISRPFVKKHMTGKVNGIRDSHIRKAVIDAMYPQYTRKDQGPLAGVKSDVWSALALALTWSDLYNWEKMKCQLP